MPLAGGLVRWGGLDGERRGVEQVVQGQRQAPQRLPCNSDTVHVSTPAGLLAGTVRCPGMSAPWPVVLLISGSGPTDRNGNSPMLPGENNGLRMLAEALATRGIASVRYDKRGIGASKGAMGSEADLRFDMFADDAAAWTKQLRADPRFSTVTACTRPSSR